MDWALLFNSKPWMEGVEQLCTAEKLEKLLIKFPGPVGSPYENSFMYQLVKYPADYPFKPPQCKFLNKILNPFIYGNDTRIIELQILNNTYWSPAIKLHEIIRQVINCLKVLEENGDHNFWKGKGFASQEDYVAKAKEIAESNKDLTDEIMIKIFEEM